MIISPIEFFNEGLNDLIPIVPPGAKLAPTSKLAQSSLGKVPGRKLPNGLWVGLNWRAFHCDKAGVEAWVRDGGNTGLRADRFPGVDIDCTDEALGDIVQEFAFAKLGVAPIRTGRAPKRLLMYFTAEPFGRMRLWISKGKDEHLVEILGAGNQYIVAGIHPKTMAPYEWNGPIRGVPHITRELAEEFMSELAASLEMIHGLDVRREGDGAVRDRAAATDQNELHAPSIEKLAEAVALVPNDFATREEYIKFGYAIRAAAGDDIEDGFNVFAEWCERWVGGHNDPDVIRTDWQRFKAPYSIGWNWLAEMAVPYGFVMESPLDAAMPAPEDRPEPEAIVRSDQWLADEILKTRSDQLRFAPEGSKWYVWDSAKWAPDAVNLAEDTINKELIRIADRVIRQGSSPSEKKQSRDDALQICSGGKSGSVRRILQTRQDIAISTDSFDSDPWALNTPAGIVDLKTGKLGPPDPDALCSKSTSVAPDFDAVPKRWLEFLHEACGEDQALIDYIQRWCGYVCTGSTREQAFGYLIGDGGNGKGVLFRALGGVLHSYAKTATLDTFTASKGDRHSTDLASLEGARLVTSSETQASKAWDTQRIKAISGGDAISARLMRQDNKTFMPLFKVLFAGNALPQLPTVDNAMKRRLQVIPFVIFPKVIDGELDLKIREEYPALLAWMIQGCLKWQEIGLAPPECVLAYTAGYFKDQDTLARFLEEQTTPGGATTAGALFNRYTEWCNREGEVRITGKTFSTRLIARGIQRERGRLGTTYPLTLQQEDLDAL